ncbi:MAG: ABC transporter ATP-binding protein, partial [Desulfobacterales bacterium]|nr:ABC transporter ATP-binding protein [Desulfobacterales bacterium]
LKVRELKKYFPVHTGFLNRVTGHVRAVDRVSFDVRKGETLGLVGESGCGKTTLGKTLIRLQRPTRGKIHFHPQDRPPVDITGMGRRRLKKAGLTGRLQMVFQDPATSLNPRMLIRHILAEPLKARGHLSGKEITDTAVDLLEHVGLTRDHLHRYPHEFSGGQRQRIAVARAVATRPDLMVLDEPTSALDVSVQAQILNLLARLKDQYQLTYIFITHHLLVVKYISTRILVMYLGKAVETAPTKNLFTTPAHPYTLALLSGIPTLDRTASSPMVLTGDVPSPMDPPRGCRFHTRCPIAQDICRQEEPTLEILAPETPDHQVACHRKNEARDLLQNQAPMENAP